MNNEELSEEDKIAIDMIQIIEKSDYIQKRYISRDKIKEKIDELTCKERTSKLEMGNLYRYGIAVLNSVLEEK